MNELRIFKNSEFGQVRTVNINEKMYFVASDVAKAFRICKAAKCHCNTL